MEDKMLERFIYDTKLHEISVDHMHEKGMKLNKMNLFFQPNTWEIIGGAIERGLYHPDHSEERYVDKITGNDLTYQQALSRNFEKVRKLSVPKPYDRVVFNAFYKILYDEFEYMIDEYCVSYKKGWSTRIVATKLSSQLRNMKYYNGIKGDLSKFFDSVPIEEIDKLINELKKLVPSKIWEPIIECYHDNWIEINGELTEKYMSLRQGNAIAAIFADLILRDIDAEMRKYDIIYYRYCDDFIMIGKDYMKAFRRFKQMLNEKGIKLNDEKTELINNREFFTFLGFRFQNGNITLTKKTLDNITHKIKEETIVKCKNLKRPLTKKEIERAIDNIQYYFFEGCEKVQGGMGNYLFGACNIAHDIDEIDRYAKECIMACYTDNIHIYGLGAWHTGIGVIHKIHINKDKENGQNFNTKGNREKALDIPRELGWYSLNHMRNCYLMGKDRYRMEINKMENGIICELT